MRLCASAKLVCRIIVIETLRQREKSNENGHDESTMFVEEELACIPINNGQEDPNQYALSFSESLQDVLSLDSWKRHEHHDHEGMLYVSISAVVVDSESRTVVVSYDKETVQVTLVKPPQQQSQSSQQGRELCTGSMSLAMIRVSTRDAEIANSAFEMQQQAFNGDVNIISQYQAMSFGKMEIIPAGVFDVYLDNDISNYKGGLDMHGDIEDAMVQQLGLNVASDLADKVFFCVPGGTQRGFIAFTYVGSWKATFSGDWCSSLSATVHEFGHMIGLGHSHIVTPDYGDGSCYMSIGSKLSTGPRKSFNGAKNWQLNWYSTRHLSIDPLSQQAQGQLVYLASFVDFQKTTRDQPVIVAIGDRYYVQYNRAKGFNSETKQAQNQVTVTETVDISNSERRAALDLDDPIYVIANYMGSGRDLYIQVCHEIIQDDDDSELPDIMVLNIGFNQVDCQGAIRQSSLHLEFQQQQLSSTLSPSSSPVTESPSANPTQSSSVSPSSYSPTRMPSASPTVSPSLSASLRPSTMPSQRPSHDPTRNPTPYPTLSPTMSPSMSPTLHPSPIPSQPPTNDPSIHPFGSPSIYPTTSTPSGEPSLSGEILAQQQIDSTRPSTMPSIFPSSSIPTLQPTFGPTTASPTSSPVSAKPSLSPSSVPILSPQPSKSPTLYPSSAPTGNPSSTPSASRAPSSGPTDMPGVSPSSTPSSVPSFSHEPSTSPTSGPSSTPSSSPSSAPSTSQSPSSGPTDMPVVSPSSTPTLSPSASPTPFLQSGAIQAQQFDLSLPSYMPSLLSPSQSLSVDPTISISPTKSPTQHPSGSLLISPTIQPSNDPSSSLSPSDFPADPPSTSPSEQPTRETRNVSPPSFGNNIIQLEPISSSSHIPQNVFTNNAQPSVSSSTSSPAIYTVDPLGSSPSMYPSVWEPSVAPQLVWSSIPAPSASPTQDDMPSSALSGNENELNINANMDQSESTFPPPSSSASCASWQQHFVSLCAAMFLYHIHFI